jgi:hypothetical protein
MSGHRSFRLAVSPVPGIAKEPTFDQRISAVSASNRENRNAKPGTAHVVSYDRQPGYNPRLWIQGQVLHKAVTDVVEAKMGETVYLPNVTPPFSPFGYWSEATGNPDYVRPAAPHPK